MNVIGKKGLEDGSRTSQQQSSSITRSSQLFHCQLQHKKVVEVVPGAVPLGPFDFI